MWRFDDNTNDEQGSHDAVTFSLVVDFVAGCVQDALSFMGEETVRIRAPAIDLLSEPVTIELWVLVQKFSDKARAPLILQDSFHLYIGENRRVETSVSTAGSDQQLELDVWTHIAVIVNMNSDRCSISENNNHPDAADGFLIGTTISGEGLFWGCIDHVSVTARAKSSREILRDASLLAHYVFSINSSTVFDFGPYGLHGVINGPLMVSEGGGSNSTPIVGFENRF